MGGYAEEGWGDAEVFKLYGQAKRGLIREAQAKLLDRMAHERRGEFHSPERGQLADENSQFSHVQLSSTVREGGWYCSKKEKSMVGPPRFELGISRTPSQKISITYRQ
ncbi:MAG TPA: hypothetical protein VME43_30090 [Bryobacteraceae bacterium]|nr:hypothetical protein [Bryobacteraceae bacterium]